MICVVCIMIILAILMSYCSHRPKVSRVTMERVKVRMTRQTIEETVGGPPGDYRSDDTITPVRLHLRYDLRLVKSICGEGELNQQTWICDEGELNIVFNDHGIAMIVYIEEVRGKHQSLLRTVIYDIRDLLLD